MTIKYIILRYFYAVKLFHLQSTMKSTKANDPPERLWLCDHNFLFDCLTSVIQQNIDSATLCGCGATLGCRSQCPQWWHILLRARHRPMSGMKFLDCNCRSCPRFMQHLSGSTPQEFAKKQLVLKFQTVSYQYLSNLVQSLSALLFGSLKVLSLLASNTASHLLFAIFRCYQSGCYVITSFRFM